MKSITILSAIVFALGATAAEYFSLKNGDNTITRAGEILAVECNTISASQSVTASVVTAVTEYTNAFRTVSVPHTRYDFTITNYDGNAAVATNVLDNFKYSDWFFGPTNRIISPVVPTATNILTRIDDGKRAKVTYSHTAQIGNGNASSHYLKITPASTTYFIGGVIHCQCADGDHVRILVK